MSYTKGLDKFLMSICEDEEITLLVEAFEPQKPSGKIVASRAKKAGVQGSETQRVIKRFKTQKGNDVKVVLDKDLGTNEDFTVIFYVNDTLADDAKTGNDPEILRGVLWILRDWAKKGKVNTYEFSAWKGEGDRKRVSNLDTDRTFQKLLPWLDEAEKKIKNYEVKYTPWSDHMKKYIKKNRDWSDERIAQGQPDVKKDEFLKLLDSVRENPEDMGVLSDLNSAVRNTIKVYEYLGKPKELDEHIFAVRSHSPGGIISDTNRRQRVYEKLMKKHMSDMFIIKQDGSNFTLRYTK
jgi:hypothetical protein